VVCALLAAGGLIGAAAIVALTEFDRLTSTDATCTSCHTMATVAADPHYQQSAHRTNAAGIMAGCSDCHIPANNWFIETYTHVSSAITDSIAELTRDFRDPAAWKARRVELARRVSDEMRSQDGTTCRKCHDAAAIRPASEAGRAAHAALQQGGATCIDCHINLVHAPVATGTSFIPGPGLSGGHE